MTVMTRVLLILVLLGMLGLLALLWGIPLHGFPGEPALNTVDADAVLVVFAGSVTVAVISLIIGVFASRAGWVIRGLFYLATVLAVLRIFMSYPLLQG